MAPTLVSSTAVFNATRDSVATVSASISVQAGDILVAKVMTEDSTYTPTTPTNSGTALTWTQRAATGSVANFEQCSIFTAVADTTRSLTVSIGSSGSGAHYRGAGINVWRGAALAATPATNSTKTGTTAPSATLTTTGTNSVIDAICGDWNVASGARTYRSSAVEEAVRNNGAIQYEVFHQSAASPGSQTIGLTAPSPQNWAMLGIEIQAGTTSFSGSATATIRLAASRTGAKKITATRTGTIRLVGSATGAKKITAARTGTIRLAASATGMQVHHVTATIRLAGSATGRVLHYATATIRLAATTSSRVHTSGAARTATIRLIATRTGRHTTTPAVTPAPAVIRLHATAVGQRLLAEIATTIRPTASNAIAYELVCVARIPQTSGAPTFLQVDPIDWTGLSYVDELSKPQQLNAGVSISSLTEPVLQRLRNLSDLATELWLYRQGRMVFAGPLLGWQVQGETLTLNAGGLLTYLKMMVVDSDQVFSQAEQTVIATTLIDQWQNLDYGNFGIDTTGIPPSGVVRDATYLQKELHNVYQRVAELGARQNGFDIAVDPQSRKLRLSYPIQGVDRSAGEDAIVFDARNVTSPNIICSSAPGDVASESYGTGTSSGSDTIYTVESNLELRARYGRSAFAANYDGVSEQTTLDDHAEGALDARAEALLVPGPDTRVTPDADLAAYDVGDTVNYQLHEQLSIEGAFRIRKRTVTVSKTGQESVSLQFV